MRGLRVTVGYLLFVTLLTFPRLVFGQRSGSGRAGLEINVQVRTVDGKPAPPGTHVGLELAEGGPVEECQTEPDGRCHFIPPSPGSYLVRLKQPGYKEQLSRVDLISTSKGYVSLTLQPIPGAKEPDAPKDATGG